MDLRLPNWFLEIHDHFDSFATLDVAQAIEKGELDPNDRRAVLDKAIDAHAEYTGVTLKLEF